MRKIIFWYKISDFLLAFYYFYFYFTPQNAAPWHVPPGADRPSRPPPLCYATDRCKSRNLAKITVFTAIVEKPGLTRDFLDFLLFLALTNRDISTCHVRTTVLQTHAHLDAEELLMQSAQLADSRTANERW